MLVGYNPQQNLPYLIRNWNLYFMKMNIKYYDCHSPYYNQHMCQNDGDMAGCNDWKHITPGAPACFRWHIEMNYRFCRWYLHQWSDCKQQRWITSGRNSFRGACVLRVCVSKDFSCNIPTCPCTEFLRPTSTVLVAEVREPPYVAQADSKSHTGHDEVHLSGPGFSFHHLYDHAAVSCPTCSPVRGLHWTTALNTCWNPSRHGHERVSWAAFLLGHRPCLQLGKIHCSWMGKKYEGPE